MPTTEGWAYEAKVKDSNTNTKPGMVTAKPGSILEVEVDTSPPPNWKVTDGYVSIEYLESYEHMGTIEVRSLPAVSAVV